MVQNSSSSHLIEHVIVSQNESSEMSHENMSFNCSYGDERAEVDLPLMMKQSSQFSARKGQVNMSERNLL